MCALEIHGPDDLRVVDRSVPGPAPDQVQIAVEWGGICGSDIAYWRRGVSGTAVMSHPFVLGHEVSGRVLRAGSDVTGLAEGSPSPCIRPAPSERCPSASPVGTISIRI